MNELLKLFNQMKIVPGTRVIIDIDTINNDQYQFIFNNEHV